MKNKQAVVLLSGGLDSAVVLSLAKEAGYRCFCLAFDYQQRHRRELESAKKICRSYGCAMRLIKINLPWKGSSLLDKKASLLLSVKVSKCQSVKVIPDTYVPGRNIIFLSFALSYAEVIGAEAIFIGAHIEDYSGYPDCRPEFLRIFGRMAGIGTKAGRKIKIIAPLLKKNKAQIIRLGAELGAPFHLTWSCYRGGVKPCGKCDSCFYRAKGFKEAQLEDPALQ